MAKNNIKKIKKAVKTKKKLKAKKVKKTKKIVKRGKKTAAPKIKLKKVTAKKKIKAAAKPAVPSEKVLGKIDHFFHKISVAAVKATAPFKVGDVIHIKGHTTDFVQRIDSMQIEHQSVDKIRAGDDVGLKVKEFVREHDVVYLSDEKALVPKPVEQKTEAVKPSTPRPQVIQPPIFPASVPEKKINLPKPAEKPAVAAPPAPKPESKKPDKVDPYSNTRFFNF